MLSPLHELSSSPTVNLIQTTYIACMVFMTYRYPPTETLNPKPLNNLAMSHRTPKGLFLEDQAFVEHGFPIGFSLGTHIMHSFTVKKTPSLSRLPITDIQHPNKDQSYVPEKL